MKSSSGHVFGCPSPLWKSSAVGLLWDQILPQFHGQCFCVIEATCIYVEQVARHCADPLNPLPHRKASQQHGLQQKSASQPAKRNGASLQLLVGFLAKALALAVALYIDANITLITVLEDVLQCETAFHSIYIFVRNNFWGEGQA